LAVGELKQLAPALGIPKGWVYLAVPISGVFTAIFTLSQMLEVLLDRGDGADVREGGLD
jgi:TRAP-type C4-dicarboxylate transport system permease small subunit